MPYWVTMMKDDDEDHFAAWFALVLLCVFAVVMGIAAEWVGIGQ